MAYHGPAYGFSAEQKQKISAKYDSGLEREVRQWIESVTGRSIGGNFQAGLKDGKILCELANAIQPGSVPKINNGRMPFVQMENIGNFLSAMEAYGIKKHVSFMTVDLYEGKNMTQVVLGLAAYKLAAEKNGKGNARAAPRSGGSGGNRGASPSGGNRFGGSPSGGNRGASPSGGNRAPAPRGGGAKFCSSCGAKSTGGNFCSGCGGRM